jgi:hypothetical protein
VGIAFALERWHATRATKWVAACALFAVLGASAREYGLVFPLLAAVALLVWRADSRAWLAFLAVSAIAIAWPLRTWILTGNPFYSLALGGLFPINERFVTWIEHDADAFGSVLRSTSGWRDVARYLGLFAPTAGLGWIGLIVATARGRQGASLVLGAVAVLLVLWGASVRYTNGGLFYSLRVAGPALALGALAAGVSSASLLVARPRITGVLTAIAGLFITLPATLALPRNPWRTPWREWPAFSAPVSLTTGASDATVALVLKSIAPPATGIAPRPVVVLADAPGFQRRFLPAGVRVIPLWSPQADWLFDANLSPAEAVRRWHESGVRHIVVTKWQKNLDFFNTHSRWSRPPFRVQLVGETDTTAVFALQAVE